MFVNILRYTHTIQRLSDHFQLLWVYLFLLTFLYTVLLRYLLVRVLIDLHGEFLKLFESLLFLFGGEGSLLCRSRPAPPAVKLTQKGHMLLRL